VVIGRAPGSASVFALLQLVFTLLFVVNFVRSFSERQKLIPVRED
jgi:hypothetical protein